MTFCHCTLLAPDQSFHKFLKLSWWHHFQLCISVGWMPFSSSWTSSACDPLYQLVYFLQVYYDISFVCSWLFLAKCRTLHSCYRIVPLQLFRTPVFNSALSSTSQPGVSSGFMSIISKPLPKDFTILKCMRNFIWYYLQFDSKLLILILWVQTSFTLVLCSFYSDQISLSSLWKHRWNRMSKVSVKQTSSVYWCLWNHKWKFKWFDRLSWTNHVGHYLSLCYFPGIYK